MASSLVLNRSPKVPAQETAAFGAIAERFRRAGALDKAVTLCQEGLKKFPDHVSARVTLGWSLLDLGKYEEARLELEQVLRRAPDNLAAIRGLAELHDRFEHTLNLPMDGPGQWPPSAADVDDLADASTVTNVVSERHVAPADSVAPDVVAGEGPAVMVPADMGMPIWSPVVAAPAAAPVAQSSPVADAASVALPSAAVVSPASGMSSLREIDFSSTASTEALQSTNAPAEIAVDLAALIAEAESLEAAAEAAVVTTTAEAESSLDHAPTVELLADLDLSADHELAAQLQLTEEEDLDSLTRSVAESDLPLTIELGAPDDATELDVLAVVSASEALDSRGCELAEPEVVLEASALVDSDVLLGMAEATPAALARPEAVSEAMPEVKSEAMPEVKSEAMPEAVSEAMPEVKSEVMSEVEPEVVRVATVEPEVVLEASAPVAADAVFEASAPVEPEVMFDELARAEPVAAQDAVEAPEFANVLAFAPAADAAVGSAPRPGRAHSALPALERMLRQVHARRQQLMAESVA